MLLWELIGFIYSILKDNRYEIKTYNGNKFNLFINNTSLCIFKDKEKQEMNLVVVNFFVDPNDPTKAIFSELEELIDDFSGKQIHEETINIERTIIVYLKYQQNANKESRLSKAWNRTEKTNYIKNGWQNKIM